MYKAEYDTADQDWHIYDPDGDWICKVPTEEQANTLLSHLNRN